MMTSRKRIQQIISVHPLCKKKRKKEKESEIVLSKVNRVSYAWVFDFVKCVFIKCDKCVFLGQQKTHTHYTRNHTAGQRTGGLKCKNFTTYPVSFESDLPILYRSFEITVKLRWLSWERQTFAINQQLPYLWTDDQGHISSFLHIFELLI